MQNLIFLVCPIVMGLIMWLMMRTPKHENGPTPEPHDTELAALRAEVAAMHREQTQAAPAYTR